MITWKARFKFRTLVSLRILFFFTIGGFIILVFFLNFLFCIGVYPIKGFPCSSVSKESTCDAGDLGSIPGLGRSTGDAVIFVSRGWNGNPLQCSCLENPMDRGAWQVTVYGVTRVRHNWATKHPAYPINKQCCDSFRGTVKGLRHAYKDLESKFMVAKGKDGGWNT